MYLLSVMHTVMYMHIQVKWFYNQLCIQQILNGFIIRYVYSIFNYYQLCMNYVSVLYTVKYMYDQFKGLYYLLWIELCISIVYSYVLVMH